MTISEFFLHFLMNVLLTLNACNHFVVNNLLTLRLSNFFLFLRCHEVVFDSFVKVDTLYHWWEMSIWGENAITNTQVQLLSEKGSNGAVSGTHIRESGVTTFVLFPTMQAIDIQPLGIIRLYSILLAWRA